jgi:hypothetical protein
MGLGVHMGALMPKYFVLLFVGATLCAQPFQVGFKVGAPINDPSNYNQFPGLSSTQSRWTGGPSVEVRLPFRLSLEADALYRTGRQTYSTTFSLADNVNPYRIDTSTNVETWDFPLLLKYRFHIGPANPFISAGIVISRHSESSINLSSCVGPANSCGSTTVAFVSSRLSRSGFTDVGKGPTAGVGLDFRARYVTISPELRWQRVYGVSGVNPGNDDRFTALVGFSFGGKR